jgi:phosphatidylserine/phosphatidylglycerophosphate/cardiolipin synthase-like enzyme
MAVTRLVATFATVLVLAAVGPAVVATGTATVGADDAYGHPLAVDRPAVGVPDTAPLAANTTGVRIAGVYPNPVTARDRGEFVVLAVPPGTDLGAYELADEESRVALPNATVGGRVAVAWEPAFVRNLTDVPVAGVEGTLALANGGERIRVVRSGEPVATARYREAPEGELGRFDPDGTITWRPLGRTDRPVVTATGGTARAFVLPDARSVPVEVLRNAEERVLLAGYTFRSGRVARELAGAADRGVEVRVLLEGEPVGGITRQEARLLDSLVAAGVEVRMLGGPRSRYAFHHAKYAVVDDRAVVLTENWKPAGTGGRASRGWGAVVSQRPVVRGLAATFHADANWTGVHPWTTFRQGRTFEPGGAANGTYDQRHGPERVAVDRVELLVTPDNAAGRVTDVIGGASGSVDVVQMRVDGPDQRFLRAAVDAARRGVEVRVLLSSAWYVREENRRLVEHLRERAETEDLPLRARLADPDGRFEKVHAKGVVVDGDQVLVGSLNWNDESARENREVLLLLEGEEVGGYYRRVFDADWRGGDATGSPVDGLPVGSVAAVGGTVVLAVLVLRRVEFEETVGVEP